MGFSLFRLLPGMVSRFHENLLVENRKRQRIFTVGMVAVKTGR
jgi:hypothetical protein